MIGTNKTVAAPALSIQRREPCDHDDGYACRAVASLELATGPHRAHACRGHAGVLAEGLLASGSGAVTVRRVGCWGSGQ